MSKNKAKGTGFETDVEDFLVKEGFKRVYRPSLAGANDIGDIDGVSSFDPTAIRTVYVIFQCKNQKAFDLSGWLNDTQEQKQNKLKRVKERQELADDDDAIGVLLVKRPKVGVKNFHKTYAVLELGDLTKLLRLAGFK